MDSPSTSALLRSFPHDDFFKDMNRQEKGFYYEMHIQRLLKANSVDFSGNSSSYSEWTSNQAKDYDIRINLPNGKTIKVECKLALKPVFHSWFERDWLSRDADIFVTNDVFTISYDDRKTLEESGKKLLSTTEFVMYIQEMTRDNKYAYLNISYSISISSSSNQEVQPKPVSCYSTMETRESLLDFIAKKQTLLGPITNEASGYKRKVLDCTTCHKRSWCNILSKLEAVKAIKPSKSGVQGNIPSYLEGKHPETKTYKAKHKDWLLKTCDVLEKQMKCLNSRVYLHVDKGYKLFDDG
jgi:hypothetical protein